ncbi:S8 family serine peptidase [Luteibacter aegosomatis]|uniref:S8 family peptidase n=1 Tax=Luteibacter aegosomatis TaxID=2911537 RepID=UPI001FF786E7|nr:S8 family serine peptidase [Luteibacter aegosomatis]UPG87104.1 S8 family serine peptidase [Luteibacter aegosomatis]
MNRIKPLGHPLALAVCMSLGLTACGGGGGSRTTRIDTPPPTAPTSPQNPPPTNPSTPTTPDPPPATPQPPVDVQLTATRADVAHAAGAVGAGATIAIVDTGINTDNPTVAGRVKKSLIFVDSSTNNTSVGDVVGHGTVVAEVAAGTSFGYFAGGIAPGASLVSARIIADKAPTDDGSGQGNKVTSAEPLDQINAQVIAQGARIVNNSWEGLYWDAADTAVTASFANAYAAAGKGTLFVFAAGNDGRADPSDVGALPSRAPQLEPGWIVAVALDSNDTNKLASYSDKCGVAKNYCIAAPGAVVALAANATASSPSYQIWSGTSFAAPQVSGAAAVVAGVFPTLDMAAVRQIVLGTADDLGDPGIDAVYGNGRLDVGRAIHGPGRLDFGALSVNVQGADVTFSNDISGAGGLSTTGAGKLVLTSQANSFTGGSDVGGGSALESMGRLPGSVTVETGSLLIAHGDIGGNVVNDGGMQTLETSTHIAGDFRQTATGHLAQLLGAPLIVSGSASLAGEFRLVGAVGGYTPAAHQQVLTAASVNGTFDSFTMASNITLSTTLQYGASEVWLDTSHVSLAQTSQSSMRTSAAAQSSAPRVDAAFAQIDTALASSQGVAMGTLVAAGGLQQSRDMAAAQASLESLSGQLYAASTAVTLAGIEAGNDALMSHLDHHPVGSAWTQSLNDQGGLSRGGFGNVGFNLSGGVAGRDIPVGNDGFAGVAVSQMNSVGQLSGHFDRQRTRGAEGTFYGGVRGANWYGVGRVAYGSFRGDSRRLLRFGDQASFAGGDMDGNYDAAYGEVGYRTQAGAFSLSPFANVQFASIRRDGFAEDGGDGFGLAAGDHTTSRWQAGVGLRASGAWLTAYGKFHLDAKLGWQNAFATRGEVFAARYTGFSQWAPVDGIGLSRHAATMGMNLGWDVSERMQLAMGVDQRFADRDHSRSATASVRLAW